MPPSYKLPQRYFEIIFNIVYAQNKRLLKNIAIRYEIPVCVLYKDFLPTRNELRHFLKTQPSSSG